MDRDRLISTVTAAVDLLLWVGKESYTQAILDDRANGTSVSPLAGTEFQTEVLDSMCVGPDNPPANLHVSLRLRAADRLVEAHCQITCADDTPKHMEASVYMDGEYILRRNVSVERDGSLRPWGMPDELRLVDPGFPPLVCDTCGVTALQTVKRGRYYTCQIADSVDNPGAAQLYYGWGALADKTVGHAANGRHGILG